MRDERSRGVRAGPAAIAIIVEGGGRNSVIGLKMPLPLELNFSLTAKDIHRFRIQHSAIAAAPTKLPSQF